MADSQRYWHTQLLDELQGPSSLGMGLSGGAVGLSASILSPDAYVGFWMSAAFQIHAGFEFLSVAFGVLFVICRLRSTDVASALDSLAREGVSAENADQLQDRARRLAKLTRSSIYAQIAFLFAGALSFIWLMLLHFERALYP